MAKKHKPEEIVAKLRQVDVLTSQGMPIADAIRSIGVTEVTYCRWRNEYGDLKSDQVKRHRVLRRAIAMDRTGQQLPPVERVRLAVT
jgi:putative transposase